MGIAATGICAVVAVDLADLLGPRGERIVHGGADAVVGTVAAIACLIVARRYEGRARQRRQLLGLGVTGWILGRLLWNHHDGVSTGAWSYVSLGAELSQLALPASMLIVLLSTTTGLPRPMPAAARRDRVVLVVDSVLIAGSLFALVCSTVPLPTGADGPPGGVLPGPTAPLADLILATMVVLLLTTRPGSRPLRRLLQLLGAALAALASADSLTASGLTASPGPWAAIADAGHLAAPILVAFAAGWPAERAEGQGRDQGEAEWLHLLLPYVPVIATGVVIAVRTGARGTLTSFEAYLGWLGLGLVVARQMLTIVDNTVQLTRVAEGQQRLQHQALHDPLTGLANRTLFQERLAQALDRHRRLRQPMALLFADLDDFKTVNDTFGHAVGDRLLAAVGDRLLGCVRRDDVVARLGGDEFAVLIERQPGDAEPVGQRILAALREPFTVDGHPVTVSASVGLVVPDRGDDTVTAEVLLRRADAAMYTGKRRGKGTLVRHVDRIAAADADLPHLLARALAGAPEAAGFEVHYQPIVRIADGATVAVEALLRWTEPSVGIVDPDIFVPVAERTGLILALDDFVLDRACADAARLAEAYGRPVDLHVNVSAARFGQRRLEETVARALAAHAVAPARLVLEITETRRIPDTPRAAAVAARLRERGVRLALDDFGTGYNALAQLHALPVDLVKLDATLTDVDVAPERAGALCRSVLAICAELKITVVAERIQTATRAAALARLGCSLGQGYFFGAPRPVASLATAPASPVASPVRAAIPTQSDRTGTLSERHRGLPQRTAGGGPERSGAVPKRVAGVPKRVAGIPDLAGGAADHP